MSFSQQKLIAEVVNVLEAAGIDYMLTGSHVSSFLGEPRSTHDVDIVVQMGKEHVAFIEHAFSQAEFAFDSIAAREAIDRRDQFQLMEFFSGDKVDFWLVRDDPFDRSAFSRRNRLGAMKLASKQCVDRFPACWSSAWVAATRTCSGSSIQML